MSHHSFLVLNSVLCLHPAPGEPECRACPKEPSLDSSQTSVNPPKHLFHHTRQNMAPDYKKAVLQSVEIHVMLMDSNGPPSAVEGLPPLLMAQL